MQAYELILEGIKKSPYKNYTVDEDAILETLKSESVKIFKAHENKELVGIMVGVLAPNPFFKDFITARELIWYVTRCNNRLEHWFDLLVQFDLWAEAKGAVPIIGKYPGYEHLEAGYKELDYIKLSDAYWKETL